MARDLGRAQRRMTGEELVEEGKRKAMKAWQKVLPFGAQVLASAAAYSVGITATQLVGFVLKVSCSTPVLGPAFGLVGVGVANVLAGQASKHTRKVLVDKAHPSKPGFWEAPDPEDALLDALLGAFIFKAMGGRFSSLLPSDLSKPGALAFESIPAKTHNSEDYATAGVKRELARMFRRDGCHHCGSRRGPVIGDHMPPNKLVAMSAKDRLQAWVVELPVVGKVAELAAGGARRGRGPVQRFYPQCQGCSIKQAAAVRSGKRVLVLHLHWPRGRPEHLAGVFVGLRYNVPALAASADSCRSGRWASLSLTAAADVRPAPAGYHHPTNCLIAEHSEGTQARVFNEYLQQLPPVIVAEPCAAPQPWGSSTNHSGTPTSPHLLAVAPLTEGPMTAAAAAAGSGAAWQQQQQQHAEGGRGAGSPQGYAAGQVSFAGYAKGAGEPQHAALERSGPGKGGAAGGRAGGQQQQQQQQQQPAGRQQRTLSGPGVDGARRLPDQDGQAGYADAHAAALMAPEHAKQRAEAAFERHFAAHAMRY